VGTVRRSLEERFWDKVLIGDGCWEWTGVRSRGRGMIASGGRPKASLLASRVAWELMRGPIPAGICVCHRCDNPGCVRPGHLFLGTQMDNVRDRDRKGRGVVQRGASHPAAKLCEPLVRVLRRAHEMGATCSFMSRMLQMRVCSVWEAVHRKTWKHVP
jgi:hypothetical protein